MSNVELAWAAGFFDGEGNTNVAGLSISQVGSELLERFQRAVGEVGAIYPKKNQPRPSFVLRIWRDDEVRMVLDALWPYLGRIKKKQALRARALKAMSRSFWSRGRHPRSNFGDPGAGAAMRQFGKRYTDLNSVERRAYFRERQREHKNRQKEVTH